MKCGFRRVVELLFLIANTDGVLFLLLHLVAKLQGTRVFRADLQNLIETFPSFGECVSLHMFLHQPEPVIHLAFTAVALDVALETERIGIVRLDPQHLLDFLQSQGILFLLEACARAFQQLADHLLARGLIDLQAQHRHVRIDVPFGFQLAQNLDREL